MQEILEVKVIADRGNGNSHIVTWVRSGPSWRDRVPSIIGKLILAGAKLEYAPPVLTLNCTGVDMLHVLGGIPWQRGRKSRAAEDKRLHDWGTVPGKG